MGYESRNSLKSLNTLAIVLTLYLFRFLMIVLTYFVSEGSFNYISDGFMEAMIDLTTEAFLPIAITIYLNYLRIIPDQWYSGEIGGVAITSFCIVCLLLWTIAMLIYQCKGETSYAVFTDELRTRTWSQRTYYLFFLIRRTAFLGICFYLVHPCK